MYNNLKTIKNMETKKFYTAPKTEVFYIQTESMCEESTSVKIMGDLDDDVTSGNLTKDRGIEFGFNDLW